MKWRTDSPPGAVGGRSSKRSDASSEAPRSGVFRPLSGDVTPSGVFRAIPENDHNPIAVTKIYVPSPDAKSSKSIDRPGDRTEDRSERIYVNSGTQLSFSNKPRISGIGHSTVSSVPGEKTDNTGVYRHTSSENSSSAITGKDNNAGVYRHTSSGSSSSAITGKDNNAGIYGHTSSENSSSAITGKDNAAVQAHSSAKVPNSNSVKDFPGKDVQTSQVGETAVSSRGAKLSRRSGQGGERRGAGEQQSVSVSEAVAGDRSSHARVMPCDTGQQPSSSRASSPETNSTSGSSDRGLRATPMGSTTGLLPDNSSSKLKVDGGCMPGLSAVLTILSLTASLGNVLRLPRVVYLSGGGTFLVVYVCISLLFGIPLAFLEIGLGQFCQEGTTKLWRAVPLFKGVGYVKVLASGLLGIYYPVLMGLSLFYMVWCSKGPMPFTECAEAFTTVTGEECLRLTFLKSVNEDAMWFGVSVAFLFLLWTLFMLCTFKSEHSYRASVYLILAPIIVCLVALFVESILNDTSAHGLQQLASFHWDDLLDVKVWYFATVQMFFSTHLGFGNIVTCAGKLYSKTNALWTAVCYVVSNLVVGVLTVCIVYQWIGMRKLDGPDSVSIPEGFVFTLIYDVAAHNMGDLKQVWSALTFLVIICTGFTAMMAVLYTLLIAVTMEINRRWSWWLIAGCLCIIGFLMGIISIIPHNMEVVHILDHYVIGRMVIASTALELIAFAWIYGSSTLYNDFEFVLGRQLNPFWKVMWVVTPVLLICVEIWSLVSLPLTGLPDKPDPVWVYSTGWVLYLLSWIILVTAAIRKVNEQVDYNLTQKFLSALKPSRNWGPVDTIYRHWWVQWRVTCTKTGQRDFTFKRRGTKDYTSSVQKYNTNEPAGMYRATPSSANGTLQHNRATDRGPFTIQTNGNIPEHVCWRGVLQQRQGGT